MAKSNSVVFYLPINTDMSIMDLELDFVKPGVEEEGLDENEEVEGENQPNSGEKLNKCNQCEFTCADPSSSSQH